MIPEDKIKLLNTLHSKVDDWEADGDYCNYVHVILDEETREVLGQLGYSREILEMMIEDWDGEGNGYINLAPIGFRFANWWESDIGFDIRK